MKEWPNSHPKANAMRRKRAQILSAAKEVFLKSGFAGSSMDEIAARAGVSLMTLYRHSQSKDDLFAAVVSGACTPKDDAERAYLEGLMDLPLEEVLRLSAIHIQEVLVHPETIALIRVAMTETKAFPHLTDQAYQGFVQHFEEIAGWIIREKAAGHAYSDARVENAARVFTNRILSGDIIRLLFGQPPPTKEAMETNAAVARDEALRELERG